MSLCNVFNIAIFKENVRRRNQKLISKQYILLYLTTHDPFQPIEKKNELLSF